MVEESIKTLSSTTENRIDTSTSLSISGERVKRVELLKLSQSDFLAVVTEIIIFSIGI
jgi:hypothetical protein